MREQAGRERRERRAGDRASMPATARAALGGRGRLSRSAQLRARRLAGDCNTRPLAGGTKERGAHATCARTSGPSTAADERPAPAAALCRDLRPRRRGEKGHSSYGARGSWRARARATRIPVWSPRARGKGCRTQIGARRERGRGARGRWPRRGMMAALSAVGCRAATDGDLVRVERRRPPAISRLRPLPARTRCGDRGGASARSA